MTRVVIVVDQGQVTDVLAADPNVAVTVLYMGEDSEDGVQVDEETVEGVRVKWKLTEVY